MLGVGLHLHNSARGGAAIVLGVGLHLRNSARGGAALAQ